MSMSNALFTYTLRRADDLLILSQRLGEWCGHGPVLEEDIALTNRTLDHLGEARNLLTYAGQVEGKGRSEDDLAYLRMEREFTNVKLVETPNGNYAHTLVRSFLFDAYHLPLMQALLESKDEQLAAIAGKAVKEATYHLRHSSEMVDPFWRWHGRKSPAGASCSGRDLDIHRRTIRNRCGGCRIGESRHRTGHC